jgi:hypothetical protein
MNLRNITIFSYALLLAIVASGCSSIQNKLGLGGATASAAERAAASEVTAQASGPAQQANYESGAGKQIGQAAGQEMFNKVPYLGSAVGGVVGSNVEKGVRTTGKPVEQK